MPAGAVSVVIPARNAAATVARTVDSLASDRDLIREIVLVDDGSTDGTADIAAAAAARHHLPITVIEAQVQNAGAARNLGIDEAQAEYVYFLDADDEVLQGGLRQLVECLQNRDGASLAVAGYIRRSAGRPDKLRLPAGYTNDRFANARNYLFNRLKSIAVGSAVVRRDLLVGIRYPKTLRYDEDTWFWAAVLTRADVATLRLPVLIYNVGDERSVDRFTLAARGDFLKAATSLNKLKDFGIEPGVLKWRKAWLAGRIARTFIRAGDPASAARFIRIMAAHPRLRCSPTRLRYAARIRLGSLRRAPLSPS